MVIGKVSVDGKEIFFEYLISCNYDGVKAIKGLLWQLEAITSQ